MFTTPNMGLKVWNLFTDLFSHADLAANLAEIDTHNHAAGNGVQIPTGGLAAGAVTAAKVAAGTLTSTQVSPTGGIATTSSGIENDRPAAGILGRSYYSTDAGLWSVDHVSGWDTISGWLGVQDVSNIDIAAVLAPYWIYTVTENPGNPITLLLPVAYPPGMMIGVVTTWDGNAPTIIQVADDGIAFIAGGGIRYVPLGDGDGTATWSTSVGPFNTVVTLVSDGEGWWIVSGERDTGWQALTLASGVTGGGYARLLGAQLSIYATLQATGSIASGATWATLPTTFFPTSLEWLTSGVADFPGCVGSPGSFVPTLIGVNEATGAISLDTAATSGNSFVVNITTPLGVEYANSG